MGSVTNKAIQNEATRRYVEAIWAERLREEGFICPDNKLLCWYRVVNNEILQYIIFFTRKARLPVWIEVGYGSCPLFEDPPYIRTVFSDSLYLPGYSEHGMICESDDNDSRFGRYSEDIDVYVTGKGGRGIYMFTRRILPLLDSAMTAESCLNSLKSATERTDHPTEKVYTSRINAEYAELAILLLDQNIYQECMISANKRIEHFQSLLESYPKNQEYAHSLNRWEFIKNILSTGEREKFDNEMERRKQKTLKWLEKMGIPLE